MLPTVAPAHANLARGEAAKRILSKAGAPFSKVFFTNGGADANENAMRMARLVTGRDKVLSQYRSYHGNTGAAIVATGDWRRVPNEFARGHVHFFGPFAYRSEFWSTTPEQESERALHHLERIIQAEGLQLDRRDPARGRAGHRRRARAAARLPRRACARSRDKYGILLIFDEVMSGFGRTGDWFAWQNETINPERRRARPDHLREGRQLGLRAGGRRDHLRVDRQRVRRPGLPGRAHLLRASARDGVDRRVDRRDGRRGHRRERGHDRARRARPRPRSSSRRGIR